MQQKITCVIDNNQIFVTGALVVTDDFGEDTVIGHIMQPGETLIDTSIPMTMIKARWDGTTWGEGATPEEIAAWEKEHPTPPPFPPSPIELLTAENHLLKAQMQAQSGRNDFIEDCIAEMAMQIYNT